ncbi:MAG: NUDIX hydrolase [Thalassotalea sp.]
MFNFCPQCKTDNLLFVNKHYWTCKQCEFVYFHNTAAAVAGIIECNNQILLTVRAKEPGKGLYDLPGGFVDPKESLEQALSRELQEELQLDIQTNQWQYFMSQPNTYEYKDITYNTQDCVFTCRLASVVELKLEKSEILQAQWFDKDKIPFEDMAFESLRQALEAYVK